MRTVDGYLSKRAQAFWRDAIVYKDADGTQYVLERTDAEPIGLGSNFREAKSAIEALRRQEESHGTQDG